MILYYKTSLQCYHKDAVKCKCLIFSLDSSTINLNTNWTNSMRFCKKNGTYLAGNFNLSNATSACSGYDHNNPHWIGAFREKYFNTDQGNQFKGRHIIFSNFFFNFQIQTQTLVSWAAHLLPFYILTTVLVSFGQTKIQFNKCVQFCPQIFKFIVRPH